MKTTLLIVVFVASLCQVVSGDRLLNLLQAVTCDVCLKSLSVDDCDTYVPPKALFNLERPVFHTLGKKKIFQPSEWELYRTNSRFKLGDDKHPLTQKQMDNGATKVGMQILEGKLDKLRAQCRRAASTWTSSHKLKACTKVMRDVAPNSQGKRDAATCADRFWV